LWEISILALNAASSWILWMAWLTILWIGLAAGVRRGGGWAWRLVAGGAAVYVALMAQWILGELFAWPTPSWADYLWIEIPQILTWGPLLLALLIGLRPAQSRAAVAPRESDGVAPGT
jgi:hypothetical protein